MSGEARFGRGGGGGHRHPSRAAGQQAQLEEVQREGHPHAVGGQGQQCQPAGAPTTASHSAVTRRERQHWVAVTFLARHTAGSPDIREPEKCSAIGWFDLNALPEPLSQITIENAARYRNW
ncbi:Hypothetical Protein sle_02070 [Streptomyces leeuwenhoekii]|uniref:Nudix hydrolase domain-containing protein n=1 Tax=Streptomyces leeuwenhoekii TaxID=1437453 RepID=A0A0F7VKT6_STRLW|nr:Hypothetical Protein sle_02070 [Streptomyces leeuwenhoekii]